MLDFNGDFTWHLQEEGREAAKNALTIGQDQIQIYMKSWHEDGALQKAYPYVWDYIKEASGLLTKEV